MPIVKVAYLNFMSVVFKCGKSFKETDFFVPLSAKSLIVKKLSM